MPEDNEDIVELVDENGEEVEFEHLDTIEKNGKEYVVLLPIEGEASETEQAADEIVILRIDHGDDGEDSFVSVEDETELNSVFEEFKLRMEDEYNFEEE
jgi:uncharacterized protein YrzB (UPF0473 family)